MSVAHINTGQWQARLFRRSVDENAVRDLVAGGLHPAAARVLAARVPDNPAAAIAPGLSRLDPPDGLPDLERAVARISEALLRQEVIGLVTDADSDGTTAHAVLHEALVKHFGHPVGRVRQYIGHRLRDGYGLSEGVVRQILADQPRPTLIITADCGSSDEARIAVLRAAGVTTVVTDHHELPAEGPPPSAYACVSPARQDSRFPDRTIAGCMVAWLLMCAVRRELLRRRLPDRCASLARSLDLVALGTVADCVSLARSHNNRAVVRYGLQLISGGARPAWRAARAYMGSAPQLSALDVSFQLSPRLNARGQLDEALAGVRFLLAPNDASARRYAALLNEENDKRRRIERTLLETALEAARAAVSDGRAGLAIWLPQGHPGVHGIVASRLVERFGRPAACLSPHFAREGVVTGSVRGIPGVHVRALLETVQTESGGLLLAYGGHEGAGGLQLPLAGVGSFQRLFDMAVHRALGSTVADLAPAVWSDGALRPDQLGVGLVEALALLEPYGRDFPPASFEGRFRIDAVLAVGEDGRHMQLTLSTPKGQFSGIWFNGAGARLLPGTYREFVFSPELNWYNGASHLQVRIHGLVGV